LVKFCIDDDSRHGQRRDHRAEHWTTACLTSDCIVERHMDYTLRVVLFLYMMRCPHSLHRIGSLDLISFLAPQSLFLVRSDARRKMTRLMLTCANVLHVLLGCAKLVSTRRRTSRIHVRARFIHWECTAGRMARTMDDGYSVGASQTRVVELGAKQVPSTLCVSR
jgi:hypothetical protein